MAEQNTEHKDAEMPTETAEEEATLNTADVEMADAAPPTTEKEDDEAGDMGDEADDADPEANEMVPPEVNQEIVSQLEEMGFSHDRSVRAVHFSGNSTIEGAMNWLDEHQGDEDIDTALLVPKKDSKPKKKLTPEEAKAKAAELQARAKAKREAAEKVSEKEREKQRIMMGKEMAAAVRAEEEQRFKRLADERKREKEEEARARAKIKAKLEQDRRERRKKLGLPEELTPEEQEEERRKAEEAEAAQAQKVLPVKPVTTIAKMREELVQMKKNTPDTAQFHTCCKTLMAYCRNVFNHPDDPAKRRINMANKAYQQRVASLPGGPAFLYHVGFKEEDGALVLPKRDAAHEKAILTGAGDVLDSALTNPMFGLL